MKLAEATLIGEVAGAVWVGLGHGFLRVVQATPTCSGQVGVSAGCGAVVVAGGPDVSRG